MSTPFDKTSVSEFQPGSVEDVSAILADASRKGRSVSIRGAGTKAAWATDASAPELGDVLSTSKLSAVLAHRHGDLTATVQAGARLADVNRVLAQKGQWIALDPPWADRATIGGIVAANDSGPRRHRYGAPRDQIIGVDFVRADGVAAKAGGIVVKNVAGYDIARLLTGSFGSLAVIVSATFKLFPIAEASRTVVVDAAGGDGAKAAADRIGRVVAALLGSQVTPTAVELQAPPARLLVRFETIDVAAQQQAEAAVSMAQLAGAGASILSGDEEHALWDDHARRPWEGDGAVLKITLLPTEIAPTLAWLDDAAGANGYEAIGRAGVGVLIARIDGGVERQARVIDGLRARLRPGAGSVVVVRAPANLHQHVDLWGPMGDGFAVMRAIKRQFDPRGILNPGRGPGGI